MLTGSPVRRGFRTVTRDSARVRIKVRDDEFCLLAFGGSQAADTINRAVEGALPSLAQSARAMHVLHMCGNKALPRARELAGGLSPSGSLQYRPEAYRDDLWNLCAAADLIVCRAGGSSLSEIAVVGAPAILVPYPYATDDHQAFNAAHFERLGAALVVPDAGLDGPRLGVEVVALMDAPERRRTMAERFARAGRPDAAERILRLAREAIS